MLCQRLRLNSLSAPDIVLSSPPKVLAPAAAVVVGLGGLRVVVYPESTIMDDRFFGYSDLSQMFIAIALGYFVWDLVACVRHRWGAGFTVHGGFL